MSGVEILRECSIRCVLVIGLALVSVLPGCKKELAPLPQQATAAKPAVVKAPVVADKVAALSADQLREAATTALREQRLYTPAGDNAIEYYLALREKQPDAPAVSSALTDLMPYALIATEQSIARKDFPEAQRLYGLMDKTDPTAPALPRLQQAILVGQEAVATRAEQKLQGEEETKRQAALDKQRAADLLKTQDAAQKLTAQQASEQQAAQQLADQQTAQATETQRLADEKAAADAAAAAQVKTAAAAKAPPPPPPAPTLRAISTPAPAYPREAQRRGRPGEVEVEFTVGTDGSVSAARVVRATPPRVFDRETLAAVQRWRFQPVDSPVTTRRTIEFKPPQ